ncbi:MAG TPA: prepilin-type N-terminal cleavage/methylation domain-containing protein [Candidatus Omnitrophota bacterium]|nr:prepilin-type N-terminal cleavage/methylation domain-containing protein [Candidatus Omnitrophota bacterium]HQL42082.1 prepilin-type N-terminal cleavage/methylation domain-containing protein [Candidatus Omnitrophota bacterium]
MFDQEHSEAAINKFGFTLLEVIIVIIIIAILASVAMPKISGALHYAKAKEALGVIPSVRSAMDACAMMGGGEYTNCPASAIALGINFSGAKYFNAPTISGLTATEYVITVPGKSNIGNIIYTESTQRITGTGNFANFNVSGY